MSKTTTPKNDFNLNTDRGMKQSTDWLETHTRRIKDGGMWLIPRSGSAYELRHSEKVAIKVMQMLPDPSLDKVFRAAGWKVVDNT